MKENQGLRLGREGRRLTTQKQQRAARGNGLHPRRLARSIAKARGAGKNWWEEVMALPARGQKYLHPEKRRRMTPGEEKGEPA